MPSASGRASPLVISQSNLQYLYISESSYSINFFSHLALTKLCISYSSRAVNLFAKWLVHSKDLRIKTLVIGDPFDESLQVNELLHLLYRMMRYLGWRILGQIRHRVS
jgi:hypothetical protein